MTRRGRALEAKKPYLPKIGFSKAREIGLFRYSPSRVLFCGLCCRSVERVRISFGIRVIWISLRVYIILFARTRAQRTRGLRVVYDQIKTSKSFSNIATCLSESTVNRSAVSDSYVKSSPRGERTSIERATNLVRGVI